LSKSLLSRRSLLTAIRYRCFRGVDAAGFAERLMPFGMSIEVGDRWAIPCPAPTGINWRATWVSLVVVHGERRAREMEEVAETLRSIGIEADHGSSGGTADGLEPEARGKGEGWTARPANYEEFAKKVRSNFTAE
jgi:Domain of unknown function (DUF1932)